MHFYSSYNVFRFWLGTRVAECPLAYSMPDLLGRPNVFKCLSNTALLREAVRKGRFILSRRRNKTFR
jgi:hypothetical protein